MICCAFRFVNSDGEPNGWRGIAFAPTMVSLFWQIDRHGDPYGVQIARISNGSACLEYIEKEDDVRLGEGTPEFEDDLPDEDRWYTPNWKAILRAADKRRLVAQSRTK